MDELNYDKRDAVIKNLINLYERSKEDFILKSLQHHGYNFTSIDELKERVNDFKIIAVGNMKNLIYKNKPICCFIDEPIIDNASVSFKGKIL